MELRQTRNLSAGVKTLLVMLFAVTCGFMWRVRGDHGYGSMWGMFAVGTMMVLIIFAFFGNKRKMTYEAIPIAVFLLGITNGGWGTLNSQMGGYLGSTVPFTGEEVDRVVSISPYSGLWVMLLLGFGWMPLFALYLGSLFSKKNYKFKDYVLLIALFYIVVYAFQFFAAHYILPFIHGEAVEYFKEGLADKGIEMSPMMAYIRNLGSESWFKKIPFGRNYFASIRVISYSAAALIVSLAALIAKKDKVTFFVSTAINLVSAVAITVADVFLIIDSDAGFLGKVTPPEFLKDGSWSLWEYFTGFFLGLGIMLVLVCLPKSISGGEGDFEYEEPFRSKHLHGAYSAVLTLLFTFGLTVARPLGMRIADILVTKGIFGDEDTVTIILTVAICAVILPFAAATAKKNVIDRGLPVPVPMRCEDFCMKAAPVYFLVTAFNYFVIETDGSFSHALSVIKNPSPLSSMARDVGFILLALMLVSFVVFYIIYAAASKSAVNKK